MIIEYKMWDSVYFTSLIIIIISFYFLFRKANVFNSYKVFYLFSLLFFGITPPIQYYNKTSFFGGRQILKEEYFELNIIIITIILSFHFLYKVFCRFNVGFNINLSVKRISNFYFLVVSLLFFINKVLLFNDFSIYNFFLRVPFTVIGAESTFVRLILSSFSSVFPVVLLSHLFILWRKNISMYRIVIIVLLLFASFPTTLSRTNFGVLLAPLLFFLFPVFYKKNNFTVIFLALFLYFFPLMDQFRRIKSLRELRFGPNLSFFNTPHLDSYYNYALIYNDIPIQYGRQLLGVAFFFIPRDLWINKPIGSGALMAEKLNMNYTNLSANYFAEGYINFGFVGMYIFLFLLAFVMVIIDKSCYLSFKSNSPLFYIYMQVVFLFFYLLRGDLMSSFATLVALIIYNIIVLNILYKPTKA